MVAALRIGPGNTVRPSREGRTPVYIIASTRPGTGKTFLARLLIGYYLVDRRPVQAFDLDMQEPALVDYAPSQTVVADLSKTQGQMALFDRLIVNDGKTKILDLPHLSFRSFFALAEQIGFFEEAPYHAVEPVILFPADLHPTSAKAYAALQGYFPQTILVPVQNEAVARVPKFRELFPTYRTASVPLFLPILLPPLKAVLDRHKYSFADLHDTLPLDIPVDVCLALRRWIKRAFLELRELELRLLLENLRGSLPGFV